MDGCTLCESGKQYPSSGFTVRSSNTVSITICGVQLAIAGAFGASVTPVVAGTVGVVELTFGVEPDGTGAPQSASGTFVWTGSMSQSVMSMGGSPQPASWPVHGDVVARHASMWLSESELSARIVTVCVER